MGYVIKHTLTATENHPTRAGEVLEFILVKKGYVRNPDTFLLDYECYKSKKTAERYMNQHIENDYRDDSWDSKYEIVEV